MTEFVRKYRNALLLACLLCTLAVSWFFAQERLTLETRAVSLPVETVSGVQPNALEAFRARREEAFIADMAALQSLCDQPALDDATRADAAAQLQALIATREAQLALEGALSLSGVAPCAAVITPGSVTIVTEKATLTEGESALVLTLAQAHAGVAPSGVRVITAENAP